MKKVLAITAAAAIMAMAGTAMAATTTTATLNVDAEVLAVCTASPASDINFGTLDPLNDPAISSTATKPGAVRGQIVVRCTQGTSYTLGVNNSETIANGGNTITYTPVVITTPNSGDINGVSHYVDATVALANYVDKPAGAYTGTLVVTVTY